MMNMLMQAKIVPPMDSSEIIAGHTTATKVAAAKMQVRVTKIRIAPGECSFDGVDDT
jgi:hypothetical protein